MEPRTVEPTPKRVKNAASFFGSTKTKKDTKKGDKPTVKTPESRRSEADDHYVDLDSVDESPSDSSGEMGAELFRAWADVNFQKGNLSPSTGQSQQHWLFGDQGGSSESGSLESSEDKRGEKASSSGGPSRGRGHVLSSLLMEQSAATSVGSSLHYSGQCKPCRFITFSSGCRNKADCPFCHNEEHLTDPTTAERPPKGVRSGYRKSVNQVLESDMTDDQKRFALKQLAQRSPYLRVLVRRIMPEIEEGEAKNATKVDPKDSSKQVEKPREPGLQPSTLISL